jgi:hypothetical protein
MNGLGEEKKNADQEHSRDMLQANKRVQNQMRKMVKE